MNSLASFASVSRMLRLVRHLAALVGLSMVAHVTAQSVTFTTATTIGSTNLAYENYDVTVDGATVTINGAHTFNSLTIVNAGTVTHAVGTPMNLTITTDATVNFGCSINVSGKGFSWTVNGGGPGGGASSGSTIGEGGSYGGAGGASSNRSPMVRFYGSFTQPSDMGSAGGNYSPNLGGNGGGVVRMTVGGTLRVDGYISSYGNGGAYGSGGGSGGSIWIDAGTLVGLGVMDASGGNAGSYGGGGGGGRISITFTQNLFFGTIRAWGGAQGGSASDGGAGSIFLKDRANQYGDLTLDNLGRSVHSTTDFTGTVIVRNLTIGNNAILSPAPQDPALHIDVRGDATIHAQGYVSASGRGFSWPVNGGGPGGGAATGSTFGEGGSYGGAGGWSSNRPSPPVSFYGSFEQPVDMGSAGGNYPGSLGGNGGGVVRMTVAGTLRVDGYVYSDGSGGATYAGGGSGGSILFDAGTFAGLGLVQANGGGGGSYGGGGGGGRISITYTQSLFVGTIRAWGGPNGGSAADGGAGTIYVRNRANQYGDLTLDNFSRAAHSTTDFTGLVTVRDLIIRDNAMLSHLAGDASLELDVRGNCTITASGRINAYARGHGPGQGSGAGSSSGTTAGGGGAGHGGLGGRSGANYAGGFVYGDVTQPITVGSGGGNGQIPNYGGWGGGKVKLTVVGTLLLDGLITADGSSGVAGAISSGYGGGGSGGSIWITTGAMTGGGQVTARGGYGNPGNGSWSGGGGAGGRIAIHSTNTGGFIGAIERFGGAGWVNGANGTYYLSSQPEYTHNVLNLSAGATARFEVVGATPLAWQLFTYSFTGTGSTPIPGYFTLGIDQPQVMGLTLANGSGIATIAVALPAGTNGIRIWSQPVENGPVVGLFRLANVVGRIVQ